MGAVKPSWSHSLRTPSSPRAAVPEPQGLPPAARSQAARAPCSSSPGAPVPLWPSHSCRAESAPLQVARPGPSPADLSPDTQEARGRVPAPLCSPAGLRARAPPPLAGQRRFWPGPGALQVLSMRPFPNLGPFCPTSLVWTPRGAGRRQCAQPGAGAGECLGQWGGPGGARAGLRRGGGGGRPGPAALEPGCRAGVPGRLAFGDDAAVPTGSSAPSGGGAHGASGSWVPQWRLPSAQRCSWAGAGAGAAAIRVRPVFARFLPGRTRAPPREEFGWGRAGVSPPWWAQAEAPGWEGAAGSVGAPELAPPGPCQGCAAGSRLLPWPRAAPPSLWGKAAFRPPARLHFTATHPGNPGARE